MLSCANIWNATVHRSRPFTLLTTKTPARDVHRNAARSVPHLRSAQVFPCALRGRCRKIPAPAPCSGSRHGSADNAHAGVAVIIHKHYVIGPETPGDATPRPPEQSGAQRTIFAAPQSETLSAWERLADDDEPFDDGEPLDDLPDDVTEQERTEIERFDLNRYR